MNSPAEYERSGGVDSFSHDESPPPSPSPAVVTGLEGLGDPAVQEQLWRENEFILHPPEMETARAETEVNGSGMIGGEVHAGAPERASSSLAVGYGCTYVASDTATIQSSVSHVDIGSPVAAGAVAGDGFGGAASSPGVGGGGGDASGGGGGGGYGGGGRGPAADSLTMVRRSQSV